MVGRGPRLVPDNSKGQDQAEESIAGVGIVVVKRTDMPKTGGPVVQRRKRVEEQRQTVIVREQPGDDLLPLEALRVEETDGTEQDEGIRRSRRQVELTAPEATPPEGGRSIAHPRAQERGSLDDATLPEAGHRVLAEQGPLGGGAQTSPQPLFQVLGGTLLPGPAARRNPQDEPA